jgi:hypothetical protein
MVSKGVQKKFEVAQIPPPWSRIMEYPPEVGVWKRVACGIPGGLSHGRRGRHQPGFFGVEYPPAPGWFPLSNIQQAGKFIPVTRNITLLVVEK